MQISFGDDALSAYVESARHIRQGYTVALLNDGEEPDGQSGLKPGTDVRFVSADHSGVSYIHLDSVGEPTSDEVIVRPWAEVARIHVY